MSHGYINPDGSIEIVKKDLPLHTIIEQQVLSEEEIDLILADYKGCCPDSDLDFNPPLFI
jgi:hypothetical protein